MFSFNIKTAIFGIWHLSFFPFQSFCHNLRLLDLSNCHVTIDCLMLPIEEMQKGCPLLEILRLAGIRVQPANASAKAQVYIYLLHELNNFIILSVWGQKGFHWCCYLEFQSHLRLSCNIYTFYKMGSRIVQIPKIKNRHIYLRPTSPNNYPQPSNCQSWHTQGQLAS